MKELFWGAFALLALGCAGATPEPTSSSAEAPTTFAEQVALGQSLYVENCAGCHGDAGQGSDGAPPVVGIAEGALPLDPPPNAKFRKSTFTTVTDVAAFVTETMPPKAPGSLSEEAYWSILAFDLKANGIELDEKLGPVLAAELVIPR